MEANTGTKNKQAILSTDRDTYMLSPCSEHMFLVVELCQEILVSQLQLANFELFSSMVKEFRVSVQAGPPTLDWVRIDTFFANVRVVLLLVGHSFFALTCRYSAHAGHAHASNVYGGRSSAVYKVFAS